MKLPDRIFAIGGAGKEITLELLEKEWVIRDFLEPKADPETLTVRIIDTAEGEKNTDKERVREIREQIDEIENELRDSGHGRVGSIDIKYKLITENIHLGGSIDLLGDEAVPQITAGNGMDEDDWWLQDDHINENLDFAKGVVRKRGLGKAIYYKAYAEDDEISSYIDLPEKGRVAVLVGLGGGTGSGILMDLARDLQRQHSTAEITLFGILPNHTEGIKENTNAFAALSELEYNALQGENVFKDRVIVPIDPTDFDGKTGNRIQTQKYLKELDEAVLYLLLAYYNTQHLEDPFGDSPTYAPFTIGIPQVLRYNVEAINEAREHFREILSVKEEALKKEDEIYSEVERFLQKHYTRGTDEPGLRDLDQTDLAERLENFKKWLDTDLFEELEYHSIDIFSDILSDGTNETDDVIEQIEIISGSLRAVDTTGQETGTFVDTIDEHLAEILEKDLTLLARRKEILEHRRAVDDNLIRDVIEYLIGTGNGAAAPGVKLQQLESEVDELEESERELEARLEETNAELEEIRDEQSAEIEERTTGYMRKIEDDLHMYQGIDRDEIQAQLTDLQSELAAIQRSVLNAESPDELEQIDTSGMIAKLDQLSSSLNEVSVNFNDDRQAIESSIGDLKQAKAAFMAMGQEESTLENVLPWESSTEEERQEANKDFRVRRTRLNDNGIFTVGPPGGTFSCDLVYEEDQLLEEVSNHERTLRENITDTLRNEVDGLTADLEEEVDEVLSNDVVDEADVREVARRAIRIEVGETDDIEGEINSIKSELEAVREQKSKYEPVIEMFQEVNNLREGWRDRNSKFQTELAKRDDASEQTVSTTEEEYVYVKNIKPNDIFRATGNDSLAESDLFANEKEMQRMRANLEELAKNTQNQQYNGLVRRKLSKGTARYSDLKIRAAVTSQAIDAIDADILDLEDMYREAFDLGGSGKRVENPFTSWSRDVGGPWDIALSVFVDGVFLDNIRKAVQADGYFSGYKSRASELGDDILIHHSDGLQNGFYTRRKNTLNMEDPDDIDFYLRDEDDISSDLLEEYLENVET